MLTLTFPRGLLCLGGLALVTLVPRDAGAAPTFPSSGVVLRYDFTQGTGSGVEDVSGNGRPAALLGGTARRGAQGVELDGQSGYVDLPDNVLSGLEAVTVTAEVRVDSGAGPMVWALGNTGGDGAGNGYLFMGHQGYRASIAPGNWTTEQTVNKGSALAAGTWKTLTYTLGADNVATLYEEGVQVARQTQVSINPGDLGAGRTTANFIGRAVYASDRPFKGGVRHFALYNRALSASEVAGLTPSNADRLATDTASLSLGDLSQVTASLSLPLQGADGSALSWQSSNASVISASGVVTRPAQGASSVNVTLTATLSRGGTSRTRSFTATVLAQESDAARAQQVANALSIPNLGDIRGHVTLPTSGDFNARVSWSSSDSATVSTSGVVSRPATGSASRAVTLTASVTVGSTVRQRTFSATVRALPQAAAFAGYAFSYFTGNSLEGENIFFAASQGNNALRWRELQGGEPVLRSGHGTRGLRDPFLIRSPEGDRFFLIATDLSIGGGTDWGSAQTQGSRYLEVWESTDLVNWSAQRHVLVSPATAGMTWAPEAYWDSSQGAYVVFWASQLFEESDPGHTKWSRAKMLYATTRDFVTFSAPRIWQDPGTSVIDSTVLKQGDTYYRFTKDEGSATGCADILQEKSAVLTAVDDATAPGYDPARRNWTQVARCIGRSVGAGAVEGPTAFKANAGDTSGFQYYLFVDEYGGRGYIPLGTNDLAAPNWRMPSSYSLPRSPRHGTVLPVTQAELDRLLAASDAAPASARSTSDGLVARYRMDEGSGSLLKDASGNGYDARLVGDALATGNGVRLGGATGYIDLPDHLLAGVQDVTVSLEVWMEESQQAPYFLWGMGNRAGGLGNGYLFMTGEGYRAAISPGNWQAEQGVSTNRAVGRGGWTTLTYTQSGGVARLYQDGALVAERGGVSVGPRDIGGGQSRSNFIGRSLYDNDKLLKGWVRDFRLYKRALSADEVRGLGSNATSISAVNLDSLQLAPLIDGGSSTITLPLKRGTSLSTLSPGYVIASGASLSVSGAYEQGPVQVKVTHSSGATRTWTVNAVIMNSPLLPGLNADPNIVRYDDTYYIYATTDGIPGWGSTRFKVWSSRDLITWTEHPTILDLGPDVSWADNNAWAPGAERKNGKYYFYFCAEGKIGVAVADSPLGPFKDALGKPLVDRADYGGAQQIDPAVFTDSDGQSYLYWGNGTPWVAPLNNDMVSLNLSRRVNLGGNPLWDFREGLFMNKRNGKYYLSWSIDDTGSPDYRVGYAIGNSPLGPFENKGVLLRKDAAKGILGTGHHSIVQVPGTDQWYIAYHRFAMPNGNGYNRETTIDRLEFNADGTIKQVIPTLESIVPR